jgi:hypothetical protein
MPSAAVETVFRTRLAANWNTAHGVIVGSNGVSEPPSDGAPFVLIHYPIVSANRTALTRKRQEEGAARIIWNVPKGWLPETTLPIADTISALFRGDKLIVDRVEFLEPTPPIIDDDNDEGNYYELAVIVPYRYQFDVA